MRTAWFSRALLILLLLETGAVLIVVPWSVFWERNLFLEWFPFLEVPLTNHFVRGAISGLGVVNVLVGLFDLAALVLRRTIERPEDSLPGRGWSLRVRAPRPEGRAVVRFPESERPRDASGVQDASTQLRAGAKR